MVLLSFNKQQTTLLCHKSSSIQTKFIKDTKKTVKYVMRITVEWNLIDIKEILSLIVQSTMSYISNNEHYLMTTS